MFRKRILAVATVIFGLGIIFGIVFNNSDSFNWRVLFIILSLVSVVFAAVFSRFSDEKYKYFKAAAFAAALFSLGVVRVNLYDESLIELKDFHRKSDVAIFEIVEISENYLKVSSVESGIGLPKNTKIRFYPENSYDGLLIGDKISAEVKYSFKKSANYYASNTIMSASGSINNVEKGSGVFYTIRESVSNNSEILYKSFGSAPQISKAVTIGDRSDLDSYVFTVYKNAGISHVLAISGLHITIIVFSLHGFLMRLKLSRYASNIISIAVAFGFTALVGFTAGAVRSFVMISIIMVFRMFIYKADSFSVLFLALLILIVFNPYSLCSAGLQLSFLCSLGIILSDNLIKYINIYFVSKRKRSKGMRLYLNRITLALITPIITSLAASIFSFPVLCLSFDTISFISPFINLIAVPLFTCAIRISIIALILAAISLPLATVIAFPAGVLFDFVTSIAEFFYDLDFGTVSVYTTLMIIPLALALGIIASLLYLDRHRNVLVCSFTVLFSLSIILCGVYNNAYDRDRAVIEYGNYNGEYVYSEVHGKGVYIDIGGFSSVPDTVFKNGNTAIEQYVILNYDSYSVNRLNYFTGNVKVKTIQMPIPKNGLEQNYYNEIKMLANNRNCDIILFDDYVSIDYGNGICLDMFGESGDISKETLICFDSKQFKLRVVGKGFRNLVNGDVVVLLDGCNIPEQNIIANEIYSSNDNENFQNRYFKFKNSIRFNTKLSESGYKAYEP